MEAEGTLSLIAEVSIAFAGFTSVVGVFGARDEQWSSSQLSSLRLLIETSLIMLLTALLPLALYSTGLPTTESWRLASGIKAAQMLVYWLFSFRRHQQDLASLPRAFAWASVAFDGILFAVHILNASGFFQIPAAPYVIHLYYLMLAACVSFIGMMAPLWRQGE